MSIDGPAKPQGPEELTRRRTLHVKIKDLVRKKRQVTAEGPNSMRVAVIGLGGTGSAALRFLAQAGHEAIGYEQFRVGHTRGSSHGESRIIRYAYPDPLYTNLMGHAYPLWDDLERQAGQELFVRCGGLFIDREGSETLTQVVGALAGAGLPHDFLTAGETRERYPAFHLDGGEVSLWQPESGFLRASDCVRANIRLAVAAGAQLREDVRVMAIAARSQWGVLVSTEAREEIFERILVTAGPWIGKFLRDLHLPVTVTRQQVVYAGIARNAERFSSAQMPVWIDSGSPEFYYGIPADGRIPGIKLAMHRFGEEFDPDHADRPVSEAELAEAMAYARRRFPDISGDVTYSTACLYTVAPNEDFLIDAVPGIPGAHFISGCSGHGFKFTVLLGRIGADLLLGDADRWDLEAFRVTSSE